MSFKISNSTYGDLETWIHDADIHEKLFRVYHKNPAWDGENPEWQYINTRCDFMFFTEIIPLPDGDILIGMQSLDEDAENKRFDSVEYYKLSEIHFEYFEKDNIELWEDEYDDYQMPTDEDCEYIKDGLDSESN